MHDTTLDRLAKHGKFQDMWDIVINRILDAIEHDDYKHRFPEDNKNEIQ